VDFVRHKNFQDFFFLILPSVEDDD